MAHVFAKADTAYAQCRDYGLVEVAHVDAAENALPLCPLCHSVFDRDPPLLLVVPHDLDYFCHMEDRWQRAFHKTPCLRPPLSAHYQDHCRQEHSALHSQTVSANQVHSQASITASEGLCGGLYDCFMVTDYLSSFEEEGARQRRLKHTRIWYGDPRAIIWRAKKKISSIPALPEHLDSVKAKILHLDSLYDKGNRQIRDHLERGLPLLHDQRPEDDDDSNNSRDPTRFSHLDPYSAQPPTTRTPQSPPDLESSRTNPPFSDIVTTSNTKTRKRQQLTPSTDTNTSSRKRLKCDPLPAGAAVSSINTQQIQPLWRWGGPMATTNQVIEYWKTMFAPAIVEQRIDGKVGAGMPREPSIVNIRHGLEGTM